MDERELEGALRARLHQRFDQSQATPELRASVSQVFSTRPATVGIVTLTRRRTLGASLLAAAAVLVAVVVVSRFGASLGPGGPASSASPDPTPEQVWQQ